MGCRNLRRTCMEGERRTGPAVQATYVGAVGATSRHARPSNKAATSITGMLSFDMVCSDCRILIRRCSALVFSAAGFSMRTDQGETMGPYVDSVTSDEILPPSTGVCIIGGGIIGTSAAFALISRGIPVVLCEKGYIACEQSSRNWGWCRQAGRD